MSCQCPENRSQKKSGLPWLLLTVAAVGVSTWLIVNHTKEHHGQSSPDDLLDVCERAARMLDERVGVSHSYS